MTSRLGVVPNQEKTPRHTIRVPDDLWSQALARAEERGETVSDAVRKFLRRYTR